MATLIPNSFSSYILSPQEEDSGTILTLEQKMVLQNKLSEIAIQKINKIFDPANPADYAQQCAYLQAQLDVINWLLDSSTSVEERLRNSNKNVVEAESQDSQH